MPSARESSPLVGSQQVGAAGQPHQRQLLLGQPLEQDRGLGVGRRVARRVGEAEAFGEVDQAAGLLQVRGPDDLHPDPLHLLQHFAPLDEGGEQQVGERGVVEEQAPQRLRGRPRCSASVGHDRGEEDGLAGEQVHLAEEAAGSVADDLAAGGVENRGLALEDRDERVGLVADPEQLLADRGGALLAVLGRVWSCELERTRLTGPVTQQGYPVAVACLAAARLGTGVGWSSRPRGGTDGNALHRQATHRGQGLGPGFRGRGRHGGPLREGRPRRRGDRGQPPPAEAGQAAAVRPPARAGRGGLRRARRQRPDQARRRDRRGRAARRDPGRARGDPRLRGRARRLRGAGGRRPATTATARSSPAGGARAEAQRQADQ